jgi:hypothetical protein
MIHSSSLDSLDEPGVVVIGLSDLEPVEPPCDGHLFEFRLNWDASSPIAAAAGVGGIL